MGVEFTKENTKIYSMVGIVEKIEVFLRQTPQCRDEMREKLQSTVDYMKREIIKDCTWIFNTTVKG